jgi:hypothetical protein
MKRLSRDAWLTLGLAAVLILITIAAALQETEDVELPPLTGSSAQPMGGQALWLWLEALGYTVSSDTSGGFAIPEEASLALLLEPSESVTDAEWLIYDHWVEAGGALLIAGDGWGAYSAASHYDFSINYRAVLSPEVAAQTPLLNSPIPQDLTHLEARAVIITQRQDYVTLVGAGSAGIIVTFEHGEGRVILSSAAYPFTNRGLKEAGNSELALSLISAGGPPGTLWYDDWHHGIRPDRVDIVGPEMWVRYTPAGRSLLLVGGIIFLALILQGRGFGRPAPLPHQLQRRSPLEHLTAMADLSRRARHRQAVLRSYYHAVKRHIGRRYRLDPTLNDSDYLAALSSYNPHFDLHTLADLLNRLQQRDLSENELVKLAAEATDWMKSEG